MQDADYSRGSYARLVLRGSDGTRQTRYVKVESANADGMHIGQRVTKDGDTWERVTRDAVRREIIVWTAADLIAYQPLRLSLRYGTLVEAEVAA